MKKIVVLVSIVFAVCNFSFAQFTTSSKYDISNWTQVPGSGTIDISGAPDEIVFISANDYSGLPDSTYIMLEAPANGVVKFNWTYSTVDGGDIFLPGAYFDFPFYIINGTAYMFSSYDPFGADVQSGIETFTVAKGQTFGFGAYSVDSGFGACTINTFSFSLPVVPIAYTFIVVIFILAAITVIVKKRRSFQKQAI